MQKKTIHTKQKQIKLCYHCLEREAGLYEICTMCWLSIKGIINADGINATTEMRGN